VALSGAAVCAEQHGLTPIFQAAVYGIVPSGMCHLQQSIAAVHYLMLSSSLFYAEFLPQVLSMQDISSAAR
jgi:hypothetical protein